MNYLVIGAGAAGTAAVQEIIKRRKENDRVVLVTEEPYPSYYRPRLIECLSGGTNIKDIIVHSSEWFNTNGIDLRTRETALKILAEEKRLVTDKADYSYDKLLLACGASPLVPPINGRDKKNIFTLRSAADAEEIRRAAEKSEKAAVVGGGLLGLESAYNLARAGLEVAVIERMPRLLPRHLDEKAAEILKNILGEKGLNFHLNANIERFAGGEKAEAAELDNGTVVEAGLVLVSAGIRPNTSLAETVKGIEVNRGVKVDEFMQTSIENIYAAGDAAEYRGLVYGIWDPSRRQGRTAGLNMAGEKTGFVQPAASHKLKVAGVNVVSAGETDFDLKNEYEVESGPHKYRKTVYDGSKNPIGLIEVGEFEEERKIVSPSGAGLS